MRTRLFATLLVLLATACGGDTTPSEPEGCLRLDGAYALTFSEGACGRSGVFTDRVVAVNQTGCNVNAVFPGYALLDGTVTGDTLVFSLTLLVSSSGSCGNAHLSGTGRISTAGGRTTVAATYGTSAPGPAGCSCLPAPGHGSFTLQ